MLLALGAGVGVGALRHQQQDRAVEQQAGSVAAVGLTLIGGDLTTGSQVELRVRVDNRSPQDLQLRRVSVSGTPLLSAPLDLLLTPGEDTLIPLSARFGCTNVGASLPFPDPVTLLASVRTGDGRDHTSTRTAPTARPDFVTVIKADLDRSCGVPGRDSPPYVLPRGLQDVAPGVVRVPLTVQNPTVGVQRVLGLVTESGRPVTLMRDGQPQDEPVVLPPGDAGIDGPVVTLAGEYVCGPPDPTRTPVTLLLRYDTGPGTPVGVTGVVVFTTRSPGTTSRCG